jgi:hypothetical protein
MGETVGQGSGGDLDSGAITTFEMQTAKVSTSETEHASSNKQYDTSGPRLALVLGSLWLGGLFVALGENFHNIWCPVAMDRGILLFAQELVFANNTILQTRR